jgi:plasmid maintenance system antidote protein VapI
MIGCIYFIQEGRDGAIKIGWTSNDPQRRRDNLQIGNSHDLHLIGVVPSVEKGAEASWHLRLSAHRKRSEWFFPTAEVLAAVRQQFPAPPRETLKPVLVAIQPGKATETLVKWMRLNRIRQVNMAKDLGISQGHFSQIMRGQRGVSRDFALKVQIYTGGEVQASEMLGLDAVDVSDRRKREGAQA